jgi:hypothetical protein
VTVQGTSAHLIGKHIRATTKFMFLGIVFHLEAIKLKAGHGCGRCSLPTGGGPPDPQDVAFLPSRHRKGVVGFAEPK